MKRKKRITGWVTPGQYDFIKDRADEIGEHIGKYLYRLAVYDKNYDVLRKMDRGDRMVRRKK